MSLMAKKKFAQTGTKRMTPTHHNPILATTRPYSIGHDELLPSLQDHPLQHCVGSVGRHLHEI
jgi:hypothetical protein